MSLTYAHLGEIYWERAENAGDWYYEQLSGALEGEIGIAAIIEIIVDKQENLRERDLHVMALWIVVSLIFR